MKLHLAVVLTFALAITGQLRAQVFSPSDAVLGGEVIDNQFVLGAVGTVANTNNWPMAESPEHIIDGVGQKYLNFGREDTGVIITPSSGSSVANRIKFWTANDAEPRDPASFELWGTNTEITGTGPFDLSLFDLITSGDLALPASRNLGGMNELLDNNSQLVSFDNSDAYSSYLVVFPTVKDAAGANSMQIAEIQLNIPEPTTIGLVVLCAALALARRRR
jgi:hypothetical protein